MSVIKILAIPIQLLLVITLHLALLNYTNDHTAKFYETKMQYIVNNATEASASEMVNNSTHLDQDYEDLSQVSVDPMVGLDVYGEVFAKSMGLPTSNTVKTSMVTKHTPVLVIAATDGYYVSTQQTINNTGSIEHVIMPKIPYTYTHNDGTVYYLNMSGNFGYTIVNGQKRKVYDLPIGKQAQLRIINEQIADMMNNQIHKYASSGITGYVYLPSDLNKLYSTNPINTVTVLAYVDNVEGLYIDNGYTFGIGGTYIKQNEPIVGFMVEGVKYYTFAKSAPTGIRILETFDTAEIAAQNGYYAYYR